MVVQGGFNYSPGPDPGTETWAFSLDRSEWTLLQPLGTLPGRRSLHSAIYDPVADRMLVFGGHDVSNDLWELRWGSLATPSGASAHDLHAADVPSLAPPQVSTNPSRGGVTISFSLAEAGEASVRIYDVAGRSVRNLTSGIQPVGRRVIRWDGCNSAGAVAQPGLYFCEVRANASTSVRRIVLVH
jgi:hypothetical protein